MRKLIFILFICLGCANLYAQPYVSVRNQQFILNNKPYYYIGANYWYGGLLGLERDKARGVERLRNELDFLKSNGVTNLRVLAGAEGSGMINGVTRVGPPLQPEKGKFDEKVLDGLDLLLHEMGKRNMKAILYFSNNWEWSGGFQQYLIWNGKVTEDLESRKLTWDEQRDVVSQFYKCEPCIQDYNKQVNLLLSRVNKLNKKKYIEDPAIMAWELGNEPRPMRPSSNREYSKWISETAALIKAKDRKHLVTIGHEGEMGTESLELFEEVHGDKNIDYLTIHIWPKNWQWFTDTAINKGLDKVIKTTEGYINKHVEVAKRLNKPLVLEEFGLPRDLHAFSPKTTTTSRDTYYSSVFSNWIQHVKANGAFAGVAFWSFGGTARPIPGQIFWKKGDELMGDPPMEEQGLNTVFDSDTSTWRLIKSYTDQLK